MSAGLIVEAGSSLVQFEAKNGAHWQSDKVKRQAAEICPVIVWCDRSGYRCVDCLVECPMGERGRRFIVPNRIAVQACGDLGYKGHDPHVCLCMGSFVE